MQVGSLKGVVPSTFTMGNAVCGFLAILSAFEGDITTACWLIILSGFLDGLDGKVARLSGTTSEFGVQLDSLADFLSFGVAPAVIMYVVKLNSMGKWGWIISVVYIMAASYRLARFNLLAQTDERRSSWDYRLRVRPCYWSAMSFSVIISGTGLSTASIWCRWLSWLRL